MVLCSDSADFWSVEENDLLTKIFLGRHQYFCKRSCALIKENDLLIKIFSGRHRCFFERSYAPIEENNPLIKNFSGHHQHFCKRSCAPIEENDFLIKIFSGRHWYLFERSCDLTEENDLLIKFFSGRLTLVSSSIKLQINRITLICSKRCNSGRLTRMAMLYDQKILGGLTRTIAMHSNRLGFEQKNVVIGANLDCFPRNYSKFCEYIRIIKVGGDFINKNPKIKLKTDLRIEIRNRNLIKDST